MDAGSIIIGSVKELTKSFKGGVRLIEHKYTKNSPIERCPDPDTVSISLTQHIGVMCRPTVKAGDRVLEGQLIGEIPGGLGCPVHASVSGTVLRIEEVTTAAGGTSYNIVIENDKQHCISPEVQTFGKKLSEAGSDEIIAAVRRAGIAGMGGTAFPTHAKLSASRGKVDRIIVNCCESEPFVCANHRIILEYPEEVIAGAKIMAAAVGGREVWLAVEGDRRDEIGSLSRHLRDGGIVTVRKISSKYPSGSEKQLVSALMGLEIGEGKTPIDAGCVVFNSETCMAVYEAFAKGLPLISRVVTVDGDCVAQPKNLLVPIGTSMRHLIDCCGGLCNEPKKIIAGGPMMGTAQWDPEAPVTKNTSAVLVLSKFFDRESKLPPVCIRCGRCVSACPMKLMPLKIAAYSDRGQLDKCESLGALSCIECGCCTYVCPGGVPVAQTVARAKSAIIAKRRRAVSQGK